MQILDLILIILLALAFLKGLKKGLIRSLGHIFALIIGIYVASNFHLTFYSWAKDLVSINESFAKILAFIILFIFSIWITNFVFYLLEKTFNLLAIIPGSKYINNILGGALGLLESALFLGLIFYVISAYSSINGQLSEFINNSLIIPWLNLIVDFVLPILPKTLQTIQQVVI